MKKKVQKIMCDVNSCKHNNTDLCQCELGEIKVCGCGCNDPKCKDETICNSFKACEEKE